MRVALTGTHGTGKTTLLNKIIELNLLPGYEVSTNLTRKLREMGYKISDQGDDDTQTAVMHIHRTNMQHSDIVMDRCAIDCYVYTVYLYQQGKVDMHTLNEMYHQMLECVEKYSTIFYIVPEFDLEDDGVRPVDKGFQQAIADIFDDTINTHRFNVVPLTGTVEQRIEQFKHTLGI